METKWYTELIYVDEDTGEILEKELIKRKDYLRIKKFVKHKKIDNGIIKKIIWQCQKNRQQKLF